MAAGPTRRLKRLWIFLVALIGTLAPQLLPGQELVVPLQFSYSNPGARSMGFGGAFVALADDATAAFANPAGLVQLVRPEVSVEGRRWSYSTPFVENGRLEGLPSGFGIDTTAGLARSSSHYEVTGLSFLSAAYPGDNWTVALFRHQLSEFEFQSETQGLFSGGTDCCQTRELDQRANTDFEILTHGLAGSFRLGERLAFGLALVHYDAVLFSNATLFLPDDDSVPSLFSRNSYFARRSVLSATLAGDDTDWGLNGGFLWRVSEQWRLGGVYRQGPTLGLVTSLEAGEAVDFGVPPGASLVQNPPSPVDFPWVLGLGVAYRAANGGLTVSFQSNHVEYSRILKGERPRDRTVDDVEELHLGGEYVFLRSTPLVAVRLGAWLDPDHQMRATGVANFILRGLQQPGDDDVHFAAGLGIAFESLQIDLGVDFAEQVDTMSLSAIFSF